MRLPAGFMETKQRDGGDIIYQKRRMAFIGIDMHKDTHTAVVMDCWTNKLGEITFANRPSDYDKFMAKDT